MARGTESAQSFKGVHRNIKVINPVHPLYGKTIKEVRVFSRNGEKEIWYKGKEGLIEKLPYWATDLFTGQSNFNSSFFVVEKLLLLTKKISDLWSNMQITEIELTKSGGCHGIRRQGTREELPTQIRPIADEETGRG